MELPRKVDFYRLPRPVQDRFAASTRRTAPPAPLLFRRAPRTAAWVSLGLSALVLVVAALVLRAGSGDVHSAFALHGVKMLVVDAALFVVAAYGVVHAMAILRAADALPWRPGVYLFPACLVDASRPELSVWPVAKAEAIDVVGAPSPGLKLRMPGGGEALAPAPSKEQAEKARAALEAIRETLARAVEQDDARVLGELDPLHDSAMSSPIGPTDKMTRALPTWTRLDWAIAVVAGVVLGLALGTTRNAVSDEAMYRDVASSGSVADLRLYLAQGGKRSDEVNDVLLPRAELHEAETQGTIDAVQAFARDHASSKIGPEIDASLRRVMLAELDRVKKVGTVSALDAFAQKDPEHRVEPELKSARHALYVQALAAWKKSAQPDAPTAAFADRLLAWLEKHGPACAIRFRMIPPKLLDDADKSVVKSGHYPGPDALPSHYLTVDAIRAREQRVAKSVVAAFAAAFPSDILAMKPGDPLSEGDPAPSDVPTLVVDDATDWARANTVSMAQHTVFAGLNVVFDIAFVLPEGAPLKTSTKARRGAEVWKTKGDGMSREEFEQTVYDAMIDGAFDQLEKKLTDTLF